MGNVKQEVQDAYYDSYSDKSFEETTGKRDLQFLASDTVSPEWAMKIMREATPNGYNRFTADKISLMNQYFKGEPEILLGREGSVVVYVIGVAEDGSHFDRGGEENRMLEVDEHTQMTGKEFIDRVEDKQDRYREMDRDKDPQYLSNELREKLVNEPEVHRFWWD